MSFNAIRYYLKHKYFYVEERKSEIANRKKNSNNIEYFLETFYI